MVLHFIRGPGWSLVATQLVEATYVFTDDVESSAWYESAATSLHLRANGICRGSAQVKKTLQFYRNRSTYPL